PVTADTCASARPPEPPAPHPFPTRRSSDLLLCLILISSSAAALRRLWNLPTIRSVSRSLMYQRITNSPLADRLDNLTRSGIDHAHNARPTLKVGFAGARH